MPPLTNNPDTFYAPIGTIEDKELQGEAQNGKFDIWTADADEESYHLFVIPGDIPSAAIRAMQRVVHEKKQGEISVRKERLMILKSISASNVLGNIEE